MDITLTIPYDLTEEQWSIVSEVFEGMDGWVGMSKDNLPQWYGEEPNVPYISASVEPHGMMFTGELVGSGANEIWTGWMTVLCARLSMRLGIEVRDAEF